MSKGDDMRIQLAVRATFVGLVLALAAAAALANPASAGSTGPASVSSTVAGTLSTRVVVDRFRAVGRRVVGRGTAVSRFTDAAGVTTVTRKHFRLTLRTKRTKQTHQAQAVCQILFLELGELDLTLAGLHAVLRAADPTQPIQLKLTADDTGGVLGRLFCQLANGKGALATSKRAVAAARTLTRRLHGTSFLRARATIYAPAQSGGTGTGLTGAKTALADECPVLHLVLGPLHLNLLGLVVDLNKVVLDLTAVPGTLLGNIFCQLVQPTPARAG